MAQFFGNINHRIPHEATFNGLHDSAKVKVLLVLYHRRFKLGNPSGLGVAELHRLSGCNYDTLRAKLFKWKNWKYVTRRLGLNRQGRPAFTYIIADRGVRFIEERVPRERLVDYIRQIRDFKAGK